MSNTDKSELAELRRQIEDLQKRLTQVEGRAAVPATPAAPPPAAEAEVPWFVILSAIAAVVKEKHRVVSVQLSGLPPLNIWAFEGRRAIFYSHQPR